MRHCEPVVACQTPVYVACPPAAQRPVCPTYVQPAASSNGLLFGGRTFQQLIPDMREAMGRSRSLDPSSIGLNVQDVAAANNGQWQKKITFSVPADSRTPEFKIVHYDATSRGVYTYQTGANDLARAQSAEFYIERTRSNGQDHYTVHTSKSFIGALRIGTRDGAVTVLTDGSIDGAERAAARQAPSPSDRPSAPVTPPEPPTESYEPPSPPQMNAPQGETPPARVGSQSAPQSTPDSSVDKSPASGDLTQAPSVGSGAPAVSEAPPARLANPNLPLFMEQDLIEGPVPEVPEPEPTVVEPTRPSGTASLPTAPPALPASTFHSVPRFERARLIRPLPPSEGGESGAVFIERPIRRTDFSREPIASSPPSSDVHVPSLPALDSVPPELKPVEDSPLRRQSAPVELTILPEVDSTSGPAAPPSSRFQRTFRVPDLELTSTQERPQRMPLNPSTPLNVTITDIPSIPLRADAPPELQPREDGPERRSAAPVQLSLLPPVEPEIPMPPVQTTARFERTKRHEPESGPAPSAPVELERPAQRPIQPSTITSVVDIPLSTSPSIEPIPELSQPIELPLSRRTAPVELSVVPDLPVEIASASQPSLGTAPQGEKRSETPPPSAQPPIEPRLTRQASSRLPEPVTSKVDLPAKTPVEEKPDPLRQMEQHLAEMQKELNQLLEAIRQADEKLIEELTRGQGPQATAQAWDAIYRLHQRQLDFSKRTIAPDRREREYEIQSQAEQLIDDSGQDSMLNRGWHLLGRGKEEEIEPQLQARQARAAKLAQQAKAMEQFRERYMRLQAERERQGQGLDGVLRIKPLTRKAANAK
ncbi:MAG: hypothetical protein U0136_13855 [Bdellovibrionota bacterium]